MKRKITSIIIVVAMTIMLIPAGVFTAIAEDDSVTNVAYMFYDENTKTFKQSVCPHPTLVKSDMIIWESGWYVAAGEVEISERVTVTGNVYLILKDGCKLTVTGGINVGESNSFTVFAQSAGTGKLTAVNNVQSAGIGSGYNKSNGTVVIHGGIVTATGRNGAGIGGGHVGGGGTVIIYGGTVTANSSKGAGIGGGYMGGGGTVTINGGTVTATGGAESAGIGGGDRSNGGLITINGGTVTANGGEMASGIGNGSGGAGCILTINGGIVTANGGAGAHGIFATVTVNGGIVTAAGNDGAGIVGEITINDGIVKSEGTTGIDCPTTINGGTFFASAEYGSAIKADGNVSDPDTICVSDDIRLLNLDNGTYFTKTDDQKWTDVLSGKTVSVFCEKVNEPNASVPYLAYDTEAGCFSEEECAYDDDFRFFFKNMTELTTGTYVVCGIPMTVNMIDINGDVSLILTDGCDLTVNGGIKVNAGNSLTVFAQSLSDFAGKLTAKGVYNYDGTDFCYAGIGGQDEAGGTVTINGGIVTATGGYYGAGIGGGSGKGSGIVTINGGMVTATGGSWGAGIGSGGHYLGTGGETIINGGTVTAIGGSFGAGIGGGESGAGGTVTINGGTVTTTGGYYGAGIGGGNGGSGGTVTINGGSVTADAGDGAAGIGGGYAGNGESVTISGGTVTATGGGNGAGIGGGNSLEYGDKGGRSGTVTISGGTVTATGGGSGAGIGSGYYGYCSTVTISGGMVTAIGGDNAAGIGGGESGAGGTVTINGGTVTTTGGYYGAGIGGGESGAGGTVTINGGTVTANGGTNGAGIGGGFNKCGGTVTISGGTVMATGGADAASIGRGNMPNYIGDDLNGELLIGEELLVYRMDTKEPITRTGEETWANAIGIVPVLITEPDPGDEPDEPEDEGIRYLEYVNGAFIEKIYTGEKYFPWDPYTNNLENNWYVAEGNITVDDRVNIIGDVKLILTDGCTLEFKGGIEVNAGNSLTVYAQSLDGEKMGKLIAKGGDTSVAGIGSGNEVPGGTVIIHGGNILATGGTYGGAGIGSGTYNIWEGNYEYSDWEGSYVFYDHGTAGNITIYGGIVTANGGYNAAGIGGGSGCDGGTIKIYGGTVKATGDSYYTAGIGHGAYEVDYGVIASVFGDGTVNVYPASADTPIHVAKYDGSTRTSLYKQQTDITALLMNEKSVGIFGDHPDDNNDGICDICEAAFVDFAFNSKSLALDSVFAFRFKGYLRTETPDDGAYMEFKVGKIRTVEVPLAEAETDTEGRKVFTCLLDVLEVDEKIEAIFHNGEDTFVRKNPLSVTDYLDQVEANHTGKTGAEDVATLNLINAISNYAHYAQAALDESHDNYTVGNKSKDKYRQTKKRTDITVKTSSQLVAFAAIRTVADNYTAITKTSRSLVLDDETAIVIYLTPADKTDNYTPVVNVTKGGNDYAFTCTKQSDGRWKLVIPDIAASELADVFTVDIDNGGMTFTNFSALSYAHTVLASESSSTNYKYAVSALYDYYLATNAYITATKGE